MGEIDKPVQGILQRGKRKAVNVGICLEGVYVVDVKEKVSTNLFFIGHFRINLHLRQFSVPIRFPKKLVNTFLFAKSPVLYKE